MYMAKATAFVSAVEAVMQVYVGNRDSKFSRCCMCKISQICLVSNSKQAALLLLFVTLQLSVASTHIASTHIRTIVKSDE